MEITIPSLLDPALAPVGAQVMSVYIQYAPCRLKEGDWNSRREEFADHVIDVLSSYAPNLKELVVARQVITPLDLEETYGMSGGHIHHGEQSLDQFFTFRFQYFFNSLHIITLNLMHVLQVLTRHQHAKV